MIAVDTSAPGVATVTKANAFGPKVGFGEADLDRKVLAAVVSLLDLTHLRVGNAEYVRTNQSFGLSTLWDRHVTFPGGELRVRFRGKSGVWHDRTVGDRRLAKVGHTAGDVADDHRLPQKRLRKPVDQPEMVALAEELAAVRPDLDGNQIMGILGIGPGRQVGAAYNHLLELRLERGPMTEQEATAALLQWWEEQQG